MKVHRTALKWTAIIMTISLVSAGIAWYFDFNCPLIYDIFIGLFCSAVLVFATSLIGYFYENKRLLFDFFEQCIVVYNRISMYLSDTDSVNNQSLQIFIYGIFDIERQKLIRMQDNYAPIGKHKKNSDVLCNVISSMQQFKQDWLQGTINLENSNHKLNQFIEEYMKPNIEKLMNIINNNGKINKE